MRGGIVTETAALPSSSAVGCHAQRGGALVALSKQAGFDKPTLH
jgi:hypothetical protein